MCGATARQHRNWLVRLILSTRSHSSNGYSTVGELRPAIPALFTSTSILRDRRALSASLFDCRRIGHVDRILLRRDIPCADRRPGGFQPLDDRSTYALGAAG